MFEFLHSAVSCPEDCPKRTDLTVSHLTFSQTCSIKHLVTVLGGIRTHCNYCIETTCAPSPVNRQNE